MIIITDEDKIREDKERRAARKAELASKTKEEQDAMMSIREKLEMKLETDIVMVEMDYINGKIKIPFRKLSPFEQERISKITTVELPATKIEAEQEKLNDELFTIVGSACKEPELNAEFWKAKQGYSLDVFLTALMKVAADSSMPDQKYMEEIGKFRNKS